MQLKYEYNIEDILNEQEVHNLIEDEDLAIIAESVISGYKEDKSSRSEWERRNNKALDMAMQIVKDKSTPWPNAANMMYPLVSTASLQFSARAYPALIPGPNVVKGRIIGYDPQGEKQQQAIRVAKHMSWQVLEDMKGWEEGMDKLLSVLPILGSAFKKTYYDPLLTKNKSETVYPMDLVVDYWASSLDTAHRVTHVLSLSENHIYERQAAEIYRDVDCFDSTGGEDETDESRERAGLREPADNEEISPDVVLEQHTFVDLDGDGYSEPYIITVHRQSGEVLRIVKRFGQEEVIALGGKILRIEPIQYFTKFSFIPSPDGSFYDVGFGQLLGPVNETINTTVNQLLDAGTLANMGGGFLGKGIRMKGGITKLSPGEWRPIPTTGDDIRKGIFPNPTQAPSTVLFSLLEMMIKSGERLSSVTEIMTGDIPGQNTKAHVALAAIEQGMKVFNSIYKRLHRSLAEEFKKLFLLNSEHLPERDYFNTLDVPMSVPIKRTDYERGMVDITLYSDPNSPTELQKIQKLQVLEPLLAAGLIDPQEYAMRMIEATEQPNPDRLLPKPKGPDPEFQLKQQEEQRKQFEVQARAQIDSAKVRIAEKLADSKIDKEEIDSIVALMEVDLSKKQAEKKVDKSGENTN